jgi:hypothetical protein
MKLFRDLQFERNIAVERPILSTLKHEAEGLSKMFITLCDLQHPINLYRKS